MAVLPRQPGSSFKLFTYTAAIESDKYTMGSWIQDEPIQVRLADGSVYQPHNYDGAYHGWLPIPYALGNSLNVPAVKVEMGTGIDRVVDTARRMGVTTLKQAPSSYQPSLTLGGYDVPLIDMASGAATRTTHRCTTSLASWAPPPSSTGSCSRRSTASPTAGSRCPAA